uniref:Uncharacterized protein n=1 Tax=Arundo donax TaxID=35708 RepID=A0A0A9BGS7_ARUDO
MMKGSCYLATGRSRRTSQGGEGSPLAQHGLGRDEEHQGRRTADLTSPRGGAARTSQR